MAIETRPREPGQRKSVFLTIDADNRDAGKRFLITEMSALNIEKWFYRLVIALNRGGAPMPENIMLGGMAAFAHINPSVLAFLSWGEAEPLIDELLACVQAWPPASPIPRPRVATDTEEFWTLMHLRIEVLALHVGFSTADVLWRIASTAAEKMGLERPPAQQDASTTQTSRTQ